MTIFTYNAITKSGKEYQGELQAPDAYALARELRERGETLVSAEEVGKKKHLSFKALSERVGTVSTDDKIHLARNLGAMLEAGLSLSRALSVMERQTHNPKFKKVLRSVMTGIKSGKQLNAVLAEYPHVFSPLFVSMVRAGEESGNLSDTLGVVAEQMQRSYTLKKKVRGAMIYPVIILTVMVIIAVLMLIYIVPTLSATFADLDVKLPVSTQFVITTSNLLKEHTLFALFAVILFVSAITYTNRQPKGKYFFESIFLKVPIIGTIIKETNAARTARTLSSLISSGVEMIEALTITKEVVQNTHYKVVIDKAAGVIQKGVPMSTVFQEAEKIYPVLVGEMMSVGEETGKLSEMLFNLAIYYEKEVDRKTKDMSTIIEPILMVIIGAGVGFFALAMITPMYSLVGSI